LRGPKFLAAALLVVLAGCTESRGPEPGAERPIIVSLNPCTDAILAEVTAPGQLLAISHHSHDSGAASMPVEQAALYPSTGGTVEEVLALAPDLVIADPFLAPATRSALDRLGVRVELVGIPATPEESIQQVRRLAALAGEPERGGALADEIERALRETRGEGEPVEALLWQEGGLVAGQDSLAVHLLRHTGFAKHAAARGLGQGAYLPLEAVLADPPDLVIAAGEERMLNHPVFAATGIAHERIAPNLLYCGGPSIIRLAHELARIREHVR
jgi:iron complex transport system substrate-binding protein